MITKSIQFIRSKTTIRTRLLLLLVIPGLSFFIALNISSIHNINQLTTTKLEMIESIIRTSLVNAAKQSLLRGKKGDLEKTIQSLVTNTDISNITVFDIEGNTFVKANELISNTSLKTTRINIFYNPTITDSIDNDTESISDTSIETELSLGHIEYTIDMQLLNNPANSQLTVSFIILFIIVMFNIPLLYLLLKSITLPLNGIALDIERFEQGRLNTEDASTIVDDELSRVSNSLREAKHKLYHQNRLIQSKADALEKQTVELTDQYLVAMHAKKDADRANAEKDVFVANVSHELRTPLTGIMGGIDLMEQIMASAAHKIVQLNDKSSPQMYEIYKDLSGISTRLLNCLDWSKQSSQQMNVMVNDLLLSIQDMYNDITVNYQAFELLENLSTLIKFHADNTQNLEFNYTVDYYDNTNKRRHPDTAIYVKSDWTRISQILHNLIDNAIKFTDKGSVSIHINIYSLNEYEYKLDITVKDTGIGISENEKDRIFNLFHIGINPENKQVSGLGTGLTIAQRVSQRLSASLSLVDTKIGVGSEFRLECMLATSPEIEVKRKTSKSIKFNADEKLSLLYVEDQVLNKLVFSQYCDLQNIKVITASEGLEGFEKYTNYEFDALVVDCFMPSMNGFELVEKIRQYEVEQGMRRIPIFALTADASSENRERCILAGFDEFLSKPYTQDIFRYIRERIKQAA